MENNVKVLFLVLGIIIVASFFSNSLTGKATGRGTNSCTDTIDGGNRPERAGVTITNDGGSLTYFADKCAGDSYITGGSTASLIEEQSCIGTERTFTKTYCKAGTSCKQKSLGNKLGTAAYCG